MTQAIIQVVAVGPQNVAINGQPEATLFKGAYKRITLFAIEAVSQTFTGSVGFGNKVTAEISRNGDLLSKMILEVTLPTLSATVPDPGLGNPDNVGYVTWANDLGHHLLREIELEVGGVSIVKHYGRWLQIWQQLSRDASKDSGYNKMIGNRSDINNTTAITVADGDGDQTSTVTATNKLYIPLQFWFCNNYSQAFPLIACQYHPVKVHITFESLANVIRLDGDAVSPTTSGSLDATLYVDYVFLDNDERVNFATSSHEYLIEQLQYPGSESHASGVTNVNRRLDGFNHPVKEVVWVVQRDSVAGSGTASTTTDPSDYSDGSSGQVCTQAKLLLNGNDRFSARAGDYFNWVQPNQHHTRTPSTGIMVYSFATEPEKHQPTGTCNFSRIDNATLQMTLVSSGAKKSHVYMVNYNILRFVSGMAGLAYAA